MSVRLTDQISRSEARSLTGMTAVIVGLHVVGWGLLLHIASQRFDLGSAGLFGVGLGVTAYTLGMRHAFDADHIAAVDNVTRRLLAAGRGDGRPLSVGFWFSLGHSSVVFGLCLLLAFGVRAVGGQVSDESSTLQGTTAIIGTSVSGIFLIALGLVNAVVLVGILRVAQGMRAGRYDEAELEHQLQHRGLLNRILGGSRERSASRGTCTRSVCSSASGSTPPPRSRCSCWLPAQRRSTCPGMPCSFCRSCSPRA